MKCSETEERIYLYRELSPLELEETDQHLETCASCRLIMERVKAMSTTAVIAKAEIQPMNNKAQMTRRIMDAIDAIEKQKRGKWSVLIQKISITPLRYGMAALSFFLVFFFLGEYVRGSEPKVTKRYPENPYRNIELNIASFHSTFFTAKKDGQHVPTFLSQCVAGCLQSRGRDCQECANKFENPEP